MWPVDDAAAGQNATSPGPPHGVVFELATGNALGDGFSALALAVVFVSAGPPGGAREPPMARAAPDSPPRCLATLHRCALRVPEDALWLAAQDGAAASLYLPFVPVLDPSAFALVALAVVTLLLSGAWRSAAVRADLAEVTRRAGAALRSPRGERVDRRIRECSCSCGLDGTVGQVADELGGADPRRPTRPVTVTVIFAISFIVSAAGLLLLLFYFPSVVGPWPRGRPSPTALPATDGACLCARALEGPAGRGTAVYVTIGFFALLSFVSGLQCFVAVLRFSRLRRLGCLL